MATSALGYGEDTKVLLNGVTLTISILSEWFYAYKIYSNETT